MRRSTLFSKSRVIYWPSEFSPIADILKGQSEGGQPIAPALYQFNTGVMILAAAVGVLHGRKRDVGAYRQEIATDTFSGHELEGFIFLIPLLGKHLLGIDLLRPENEEELLREFERYAAGGFEILRGLFDASAGKSGEIVLQQEILYVLNKSNATEGQGIPNLF